MNQEQDKNAKQVAAPCSSLCYAAFGRQIEVWHTGEDWHPYPWRFKVQDSKGVWHTFAGIPNQCETKLSAFRRAWHRAKWFADGTMDKRYV